MYRPELIKLINQRSVKHGNFTLASGGKSNYLIDLKMTTLHPRGCLLIADAILEEVRLYCNEIDAFGGMATGAIPIVAVVCSRSMICNPTVGFFVRTTAKGHGSNLLIDGCLEPGMRTVLLEDVTTTGASVLEAVRAVRAFGATVREVITVVDRLEGARENLANEGVSLSALLTRDDLNI